MVDGFIVVSVLRERTDRESVRVSLSRLGVGDEFTEEGLGVAHEKFRFVSARFVCVCGDWERRCSALDAAERTGGGFGGIRKR